MTNIVLPHTIDAGTEIVASEHQLNYEAIRDTVNGQLDDGNIKSGANIVPVKLKNFAAPVSALPVSPADGDICFYQADAANGVIWMFRYNANSGSALKWEYIGGGPLTAEVLTASTRANVAYGDPTAGTVGPSITLPLQGDYEITGSAKSEITATGVAAIVAAIKLGAAATSDNEIVSIINADSSAGAETKSEYGQRTIRRNGFAASDVVKMEYKASAGTGQWSIRNLSVRPIRVI